MARAEDAIADNAGGALFVDRSCIDCDLCRQIAPEVFARSGSAGQSFVARQPAAGGEHRALMALVTCPTSSIGMRTKRDTRAAARAFPEPIGEARSRGEGTPTALPAGRGASPVGSIGDDILFCGYASAASYGAASYLIRRPGGNVLVDSPRFAAVLAGRIAELGGVRFMVLTHRDDVADHARFRERFGCERVIHRADVGSGTRGCERIIDGDTDLAGDLRLIHVPGHTRGSIALLYRDVLFSGDHLWATDDQTGLEAGRDVCWYSWTEQLASIAKLAGYRFTRVLPGHGRRFAAPDPEAMTAAVRAAARG